MSLFLSEIDAIDIASNPKNPFPSLLLVIYWTSYIKETDSNQTGNNGKLVFPAKKVFRSVKWVVAIVGHHAYLSSNLKNN